MRRCCQARSPACLTLLPPFQPYPPQGAWLPRLKQVVAAVNATFSANFASVGCAGDVVLHEAAGEDYVRYAIEIR